MLPTKGSIRDLACICSFFYPFHEKAGQPLSSVQRRASSGRTGREGCFHPKPGTMELSCLGRGSPEPSQENMSKGREQECLLSLSPRQSRVSFNGKQCQMHSLSLSPGRHTSTSLQGPAWLWASGLPAQKTCQHLTAW